MSEADQAVVTDSGKAERPGKPSGSVRKPAAKPARNHPRNSVLRSWALCAALPALLFAGYNIIATDRYAAGASFVVRSAGSEGDGGLLDTLSGSVSAGSTKSDSYVIRRYIESADLLRAVDEEFGLEKLYGPDRADPVQRLWPWMSFEQRIDYWNRRVISTYDNTSGIVTLEIQAYSADDAQRVASFVMTKIDDLVNRLSHDAREGSFSYAKKEMEAAESRLREAQSALKRFRSENQIADPTASAGRDDQLIYELSQQIVDHQTSLDILMRTAEQPGPNATSLRERITSLKRQRDELREEIRSGQGASMVTAEIMNDYETLSLDVEIARQRYTTTLEGLESARREAERQQRYLAVFAEPYAADMAKYPRRIINSLLALLGFSLIWGIGRFAVQMVRDHKQ